MKNKEDTTNIHYNLYANHRKALILAMLMGDTFEVGGVQRKVIKCEVDKLINEIYKGEKSFPSKESIVNFMQKSGTDSKKRAEMFYIVKELSSNERKKERFYNNIPTTSEKKIGFQKKVLVVFNVNVVITLSAVIFYFHWYCIDYQRANLYSG